MWKAGMALGQEALPAGRAGLNGKKGLPMTTHLC